MFTHSQVIIGTPNRDMIPSPCMGKGKGLGQTIDVVEVTVGTVILLSLQFSIIEGFIVEGTSCWGKVSCRIHLYTIG